MKSHLRSTGCPGRGMRFLWEEQKFCVAGTWGSWAQIPGALQELSLHPGSPGVPGSRAAV